MDEKRSKMNESPINGENESSQKKTKDLSNNRSKGYTKQRKPKDGEPKGKNPNKTRNANKRAAPKDSEDRGKGKLNSGIKFYTINGRNGMTVDVLNITDADLSALDIDLDISELLKQPSGNVSFLSSQFCEGLDSVVRAYSTSRGYVTTTSGKVVADALRLSIRAFSLLCTIYRTQACNSITTQTNVNIGRLFTRKSITSVNNSLTLLLAENTPAPHMIDEYTSISNAVWMQDYVSHLSKMYLPKSLVNVLAYLYKNVFTAEAGKGLGTNSLLLFWPYSGNTKITDAYTATISTLSGLFSTYPDLELIMKACGFGPEAAMSLDFTRPLAGNELSIVYDPEIPRLLENIGALDCGYESFTSAAYKTYFEYEAVNSVFAFDQMRVIETAHNLLYWMLNFAALTNLTVTPYPSPGDLLQINGGIKILHAGSVIERIYLPDNIQYCFMDWSGLAAVYLAGLRAIMYNVALAETYSKGITGLVSRRSIFVRINVSVNLDNELEFQIVKDSLILLDGPNNYTFDIDEASVIMQNALPTLIYGQEWRTQLQLV